MTYKKYILDLSETETIRNILKNKAVDWNNCDNIEMLEEIMYDSLVNIALGLNLDTSYQDSEIGIIAVNTKDKIAMSFSKNYKTPYIEIVLEANDKNSFKELHNNFMALLINDDEYLSGFLNFETEGGLDTVLPGNAVI